MSRYFGFRAKNKGEAQGHIIASNALAEILQTDPRVQKVFCNWRRDSGLSDLLEKLKRAPNDTVRQDIQAELLMVFYGAGVVMASVILPSFVSKELGLPYPTLAAQLWIIYQHRIMSEATAPGTFKSVVEVAAPDRQARGRAPKNGGDSIRRGVGWFYRVHVQQPPESVRSLAREYSEVAPARGITALRRDKRNGDARSIVQEGIDRAKDLLEKAEYIYVSTLPK